MIQAILRGMHNVDIRTRVLSEQNEELQGLSAIVDYIAAEEASSISFSNMISWSLTMRSYNNGYINVNKMDLIDITTSV